MRTETAHIIPDLKANMTYFTYDIYVALYNSK